MSVGLQEIIQACGKEFRHKYRHKLTTQHLKALNAIEKCRTGELGRVTYQCGKCDASQFAYSSCGNRHCPLCQGSKTLDWVKSQEKKRLPVLYYLMTFTIPSELRPLFIHLQKKVYSLMFKVSSDIMKEMMANPDNLGCDQVGFTSILHTWGAQLQYHPHIHILFPAGGICDDGTWKGFRPGFGLSAAKASELWLGKMLSGLEEISGRKNLPSQIASKKFVVDCKEVGSGASATKYLARYVFRVAIDNRRIDKLEDGNVHFRYKDRQDDCKVKPMDLPATEFIRRFMMHVLPSGFMKVRHYGFHHPNSGIDIVKLRIAIMNFSAELLDLIKKPEQETESDYVYEPPKCKACGEDMVCVEVDRD